MFRQMTDDMALVREYARNRSEAAFAALVSRHLNLVYSVALREVRDPHLAEEVTQAAFIILARKAGALGPKTILSGWLCRTARYVSAEMLRSQRRRQKREQEACMQSLLNESAAEAWMQIAPLLETAMAQLGEQEHNAIVLRFYEGKALKQVGAALGTGEDAARMRINRALEKLRKFFAGRGLTLSAAVIAAAVSTSAVQAAPAGLAATVTTAAVQGTAVTTSTLTLIKGALKIMAWTKAKTAIVVGASVLLAAGTTTLTVKEIRGHRPYAWQIRNANWRMLDRLPQQVKIVPTHISSQRRIYRQQRQDAGNGAVAPHSVARRLQHQRVSNGFRHRTAGGKLRLYRQPARRQRCGVAAGNQKTIPSGGKNRNAGNGRPAADHQTAERPGFEVPSRRSFPELKHK